MTLQLFNALGVDTLNFWIKMLSSQRTTWTLEDAKQEFGESAEKHISRLLGANFLSGTLANFQLPELNIVMKLVFFEINLILRNIASNEYIADNAKLLQEFLVQFQKGMTNYDSYRKKHFGESRLVLDEIANKNKEQLQDLFTQFFGDVADLNMDFYVPQISPKSISNTIDTSKDSFHNIVKEYDTIFLAILDKFIKQTAVFYTQAFDSSLERLSTEFENIKSNFGTYSQSIDARYESFRRRIVTQNEIFKMESSKISKSQIELFNELDTMLNKLMQSSVASLASKTTQLLDYIFITIRKTLDGLSTEILQEVNQTESNTKEGIKNLVVSVFDINKNVLDELISALDILKQSTTKMTTSLLNNLSQINSNIQIGTEDAVKSLTASKDEIQHILDTTIQRGNQLANKLITANSNIIKHANDLINFTIEKIYKEITQEIANYESQIIEIENQGKPRIEATVQEAITQVIQSVDQSNKAVVSDLFKFIELIEKDYTLTSKKTTESVQLSQLFQYYLQNGQIPGYFENIKASTIQANQSITKDIIALENEQIQDISQMLNSFRISVDKSKNAMLQNFKASTDEYFNSLEILQGQIQGELAQHVETAFTFIFDAIDPITVELTHLHEAEIPEFFAITRTNVNEISAIINKLIKRIYEQANKNRNKLEDQISISEVIFMNEFESLKIAVMSQIQNVLAKNKKHILNQLETYKDQIDRDINAVKSSVGDNITEQLNLPVNKLTELLMKVEKSIEEMSEQSENEVQILKKEIDEQFGKLENKMITLFEQTSESVADVGISGPNTLIEQREKYAITIREYSDEIISALSVQMDQLKVAIVDEFAEQIAAIEKINNLNINMSGAHVQEVLDQLTKKIDNFYLNILQELNKLQTNTGLKSVNDIMIEETGSVITKIRSASMDELPIIQQIDTIIEKLSND